MAARPGSQQPAAAPHPRLEQLQDLLEAALLYERGAHVRVALHQAGQQLGRGLPAARGPAGLEVARQLGTQLEERGQIWLLLHQRLAARLVHHQHRESAQQARLQGGGSSA